jgi:hypothetical protein
MTPEALDSVHFVSLLFYLVVLCPITLCLGVGCVSSSSSLSITLRSSLLRVLLHKALTDFKKTGKTSKIRCVASRHPTALLNAFLTLNFLSLIWLSCLR